MTGISPSATGKPVMIVTEYMENGSLDSFLRVSNLMRKHSDTHSLDWVVMHAARPRRVLYVAVDYQPHTREHLSV